MLLARTYICLCQSESRHGRADEAQHEAKNLFIHDTDFSADDRTKPRKKSSALRPNSKNEVRPKKFFAALRAKDPYPLSTDGTEMIGTDVFGSYDHTYIASP